MRFGHGRFLPFLCALACLMGSTGCTKPTQDHAVGETASHGNTSASSVQPSARSSVETPTLATPPTSVSASTDSEEGEASTVRDLSGATKDCEVYSSKSGGTYTLDVDFEGDQARINFPNGGYKYVDIDDPDSTEFTSIAATDHEGEAWEITVSDPPDAAETDDSDVAEE